jgi:hypothetical protein
MTFATAGFRYPTNSKTTEEASTYCGPEGTYRK